MSLAEICISPITKTGEELSRESGRGFLSIGDLEGLVE